MALKKNSRDRTGERIDAPEASQAGCPSCNSDDPNTRAKHQLLQGREGLDALRTHLHQYFAQRVDTERRRDYIESVCAWVGGIMHDFSGYVHPETGAAMPWWEARTYLTGRRDRIAARAHQDASPAFQERMARSTTTLSATQVSTLVVNALKAHASDPWSQGHLILMETGVNRPGQEQTAAALCRQFAVQWPEDAAAWAEEARWWEDGAPLHGVKHARLPVLTVSPTPTDFPSPSLPRCVQCEALVQAHERLCQECLRAIHADEEDDSVRYPGQDEED